MGLVRFERGSAAVCLRRHISTGTRGTKKNPVEGRHTLCAFLTTQANAVVAPVHSTAMAVLLTTAEEQDAWLSAPLEEALKLPAVELNYLRVVGICCQPRYYG
jgi:putative SOS response-associated peptidase YedK